MKKTKEKEKKTLKRKAQIENKTFNNLPKINGNSGSAQQPQIVPRKLSPTTVTFNSRMTSSKSEILKIQILEDTTNKKLL